MSTDYIAIAQRLAGQNAFEKGQQLFNEQAVITFSQKHSSIQAQVQGNFVYDVSLTLMDASIDGGCTCPASEGFDFCKHCVAVIFYHVEKTTRLQKMIDGQPADRLRAYLNVLDQQTLVEEFFKLISNDLDRLNQWLMFADIEFDLLDRKELRKKIVKALPLRDVWRYQQVKNYFDKARIQLGLIFEVIERLPAPEAVTLCEQTLLRYDKILERIDDSGGFRFSVYHLIEQHYIKAFQKLEEDVQKKTQRLLSIIDAEYLYVDFADVGGKFIAEQDIELKKAYYKQLEKRYKEIPPHSPSQSLKFKRMSYATSLARYYEACANYHKFVKYAIESCTNFNAAMAVMQKLIAAQELELAASLVPKAEKMLRFPKDRNNLMRLQMLLAKNVGDKTLSLSLAWQIFEHSLNIEDFKQILSLLEHDKKQSACAVDKAELLIMEGLKTNQSEQGIDYSKLLEFYLLTEALQKALELVRRHEFSDGNLQELAFLCLRKGKTSDGLSLYRRLINEYVLAGQQKHYQLAIDLLAEILENKSFIKDADKQFNSILADLNFTHANKPSFINKLQKFSIDYK